MLTDIVEETQSQIQSDPSSASSLSELLSAPFPPVNFPCVQSFHPKALVNQLAPLKEAGFVSPKQEVGGATSGSGPFIYTPFGKNKTKRPEVLWVLGDPGEVSLSVSNPLPIELRVENMVHTHLL